MIILGSCWLWIRACTPVHLYCFSGVIMATDHLKIPFKSFQESQIEIKKVLRLVHLWSDSSCHGIWGKKKENKNLGRSFIIQDCAAASSTQWKGSGCITALYLTFNVVVLRALCKMQFPSCIRIEEPKSQHVQLAGKAKKKQNSVIYFFLMKDIIQHLSSGNSGCGECAQSDLLPAPVTCSSPPSIPAQTHP